MSAPHILHASLIARRVAGDWRGALLRGPSGAGKSGLALRAAAAGFRFVADDRVVVWRSAGEVFGRAPDPLSGLIEVRGVGVTPSPTPLRHCRIALVVDLAQGDEGVERMPERESVELLDVFLPRIRLAPFEAAAPQVLLAALAAVQRAL